VSEPANPVTPESPGGTMDHLDEMTCLLYAERQLERARAQAVSAHAQECAACRTLLRALDRESRLLTRAMLEEDEPLPSRIAQFQEQARKSFGWIWGVIFGLAATGVYALYTGFVEPWQQRLDQAGFGGTNLLYMLVFQGAFWKGWQSVITLLEVVAMLTVAGFAVVIFRRRLRRGSALALVLAGLCAALSLPTPASATEFRKTQMGTVEVSQNEIIKGDIYISGERVRIEGTVEGDVYAAGKDVEIDGHVAGDVISACRSLRVLGQVDGNLRSAGNFGMVSGSVGKNVTWFGDSMTVDSAGKIGGTVTAFGDNLTVDGHLGRDILFFGGTVSVNGSVSGGIRQKGHAMIFGSTAQVEGPIRFQGDDPASVASGAKLASPVQYTKLEHESKYKEGHYYVWRIIWTAAFVLFGMVLFLLMPKFAAESVSEGERIGAPLGLGLLVLFGVPFAALLACVTVVGVPLGILTLGLWFFVLNCAELVVGTVVGTWILGKAADTWALIGRMALGFVIVRIIYTPLEHIHIVGILCAIGIWMWGMGAISLAVYDRLQPKLATSSGAGSMPSVALPTSVGGVQPA
jgi:cytoskeletal protein CcmA (bactofilin family)